MQNRLLSLVIFFVAIIPTLAQPTISQPPTNEMLPVDGTLTLNVTAGGVAPRHYQWFKDNCLLLGETNSIFSVTNAGVINSGSYCVIITNNGGMVISQPALVAVGNPSLLTWGINDRGQLGNGNVSGNFYQPTSVASNVVSGAGGGGHSLFVTADGNLWAAGDDYEGQLGNGTAYNIFQTPFVTASNVVAVAAGYQHSLFVTSDGRLWVMGLNSNGQLGTGTQEGTATPISVASNVVAVAAGAYHSLFLKTDGTLWAMGQNSDGQLGNGTTTDALTPINVASNVVTLAAGQSHSLFVTMDGRLWTTGYNGSGQLGNGATNDVLTPTNIASNVVAIAGGGFHSLFIKEESGLWTMGDDTYGQLGNGTTNNINQPVFVASNVMAVAAGQYHSLFAKADGSLWAMGQNIFGQLGDGTTTDSSIPVNVPPFTIANIFPEALGNDSLVLGYNFHAIITLTNLSQTYDGTAKNVGATTTPSGLSVVLSYDGSINAPTNASSYTVIGTVNDPHYFGSITNTLVINPNATVTLGNLNQPYTGGAISVTASTMPPGLAVNLTYNGSSTVPTNVGNYLVTGTISDPDYQGNVQNTLSIVPAGLTNDIVVFGGTINLNVTTDGGTSWAFQWFKDSRLIAGATNRSLTITDAQIYDSGIYFVVATNATGMVITVPASVMVGNPSLLAWGLNGNGELGNGTTNDTSTPISVASNVVTAASGQNHSLFVTSDGTLWSMGYNSVGQLGDGTTMDTAVPVSVASNVVAVAAGQNHSLFVTSDGILWAMGWNNDGQLGNGSTADSHTPVMVAGNVVAVAAGQYYSMFIKGDGTLWAMGDNFWGQFGDGTTEDNYSAPVSVASNAVAIAAGFAHTMFLKADGTLWGMGYSYWGELGSAGMGGNWNPMPGIIASNVMSVGAGNTHSLLVKTGASLWTLGYNQYGQLGDGSTEYPYYSKPIPANVANHVLMAAGGVNHSLFVKDDGSLWATGDNTYGQLGNGTNIGTLTPIAVPRVATANVPTGSLANHSLAIGVIQSPATVTLSNLKQIYTGSPISATASTTPPGLKVNLTYNGSPVPPTKAGHYTVIGAINDRNYEGSATNILVIAGFALAGPTNQVLEVGGTLTLNVTADGAAPLAYQWFKDSRLLLGATNSAFTLTNAGVLNSGTYYVVVTNISGTVISLPASLMVGNPSLIAWGSDGAGQLGNGTTGQAPSPLLVTSNVITGAAGDGHSLFVTADGTLWTMGADWVGQLGAGILTYTNRPVSVASNVVAVAAGFGFSLFVTRDGTLWAMGNNQYGQLGTGTTNEVDLPVSVASNVVAVAAGNIHSLFLMTDGTLWAMGNNKYGQLGNGTTDNTYLPVLVASDVVSVAAGTAHSFFITTDGKLWAMGYNNYGQLGIGSTNNAYLPVLVASNVMAAAAGNSHSLFVTTDAILWSMGYNYFGQLGDGATSNSELPVSVASNVVAVAAGHDHSLFVTTVGALQAMGQNKYGQLGNGTTSIYATPSPVRVPQLGLANIFAADQAVHSLAIGYFKAPATLTLSNLNQTYTGSAIQVTAATTPPGLTVNLAYNGAPTAPTNAGIYTVIGTISDPNYYGSAMNTLVVTLLTSGPTNQVVAQGGTVNLGATAVGASTAYQWFKDSRLIVGATNSMLTVTNANVNNSGTYYVMVTNSGGMTISIPTLVTVGSPSLLSWGYNNNGQLGNGGSRSTNLPVNIASNVVAGAAGANHSLFVKSDGTLWAMGSGTFGQLGISPPGNKSLPTSVTSNVVAVAAGYQHSLFVTSDGTLWAMGFNQYGQLGNGGASVQNLPVSVASNVVAVAAGANHSLFVKVDGTLWAMGQNNYGQLGNGTISNTNIPTSVASNVVAVAAGTSDSLFITKDGTLWAMGFNQNGQLGNGKMTSTNLPVSVASNVVAVAGGANHSLFVSTDGELWGMGYNNYGQLGNGLTSNTNLPVSIASNVVAVAAGYQHSLFVKEDGTLWGMGQNNYGQLGNGTTANTNLPVSVSRLSSVADIFQADQANHSLAIGFPQGPAIVTLGNLDQLYSGNAINITASSTPAGLMVFLTYNGSKIAPTNAGSYIVIGTINDPNYYGSATNVLLVGVPPQNFSGTYTGGDGHPEDQQLMLQMTGTPGYPYILQSATNLMPPIDWQSVYTNMADGNGNWSFVVTNLNTPSRFYRSFGQ